MMDIGQKINTVYCGGVGNRGLLHVSETISGGSENA
jgi:hypothetical protein